MINVTSIGCSEVATDGIGREGGVGAAFLLPGLHHGRSGTIASFAIVPGEGLDRSPG